MRMITGGLCLATLLIVDGVAGRQGWAGDTPSSKPVAPAKAKASADTVDHTEDEIWADQLYEPEERAEHVMVEIYPDSGALEMVQAFVNRYEKGRTIPARKRKLALLFYIGGDAETASKKCHKVRLKADKKLLKPRNTRWTTIDGEMVIAIFTLPNLKLLASAKSVTGTICRDAFTLGPKGPKYFKALDKEARKPPVLEE